MPCQTASAPVWPTRTVHQIASAPATTVSAAAAVARPERRGRRVSATATAPRNQEGEPQQVAPERAVLLGDRAAEALLQHLAALPRHEGRDHHAGVEHRDRPGEAQAQRRA